MTQVAVRRIRWGVTALVAIALIAFVVPKVRSGDSGQTFSAMISDAAELVPDNGVRVNDVQVGHITKISLEGLAAKVDFVIDEDVELPAGTRVELRQTSLLGEQYLALIPEGTGRLEEDATIPLDRTRRVPQLEQVIALGGQLVDQVNADNINRILTAFDEGTGADPQRVGRFLDAMAGASRAFAAHEPELAATIERVEQMASALAPHTQELAGSVDRFASGMSALEKHRDDLGTFVTAVDELANSVTELVTNHEDKLSKAGATAKQLLTELIENLPDFEKALQALPDFNNGWNCTVQGNYIQWLAAVYPEAARVDTGGGHCTPEQGSRGRQEQGQVQVNGVPGQKIDDPAGTGDVDLGYGTANENRQDHNGYRHSGSGGSQSSKSPSEKDDGGLGLFMWSTVEASR